MTPRTTVTAALAAVASLAAGCGSESVHDLPPAAEPAHSPPAAAAPAGTTFAVGRAPEGIVADPVTHRVAVALRDPPRLVIADGRTGRVLRRVRLPGAPRHLALAAPGGPVLVPAEDADAFVAVGLRSGRATPAVAAGAHPHDLAPLPGGAVAVGDERGNALAVVRGRRVVGRVPVATQPGGVTTLDGGRLIAVVSVRERVLELYDTATLRRVARAPAGVGPTHVACLDAGPCYVVDTTGGALLVFSPAGRDGLRLRRRYFLPGAPYGIALDAPHRRLYVTLTARNALVALPAHGRPHVVRRWAAVRQPDTVAVDPALRRVYVTGRDGGVVQSVRDG